ncbi:MAG: hypothetical protein V2I66_04650 [Halieaceae bacterium]|jgi:hypothetical protein|nr:hypothetical protein [Halieaceae bacterium]
MQQLTTLIISIVFLAVTGQAAAQFRNGTRVYETTDQDGVPLYSDIPSQGARPVIIPPTNPADSVAVSPPAPPAPVPVQAAPEPGTPEYNQKVQRELEEYRQREREIRRERHGETRHKVGTGTDSQRREVGNNSGSR